MMRQLLFIALGGACGTVLRFLLQRHFNNFIFPYGTFMINIAGGLLIGILWGLLQKSTINTTTYLVLATGFCGGFTTFSAFTLESMQLLLQQRWVLFLFYTAGSVAAGLLATFTGYKLIH
jgi:CrcB protein